MGFSKKISETLDTAADTLHRAGQKVAGERGEAAAQVISAAVLGRYLEQCSEACGWCNTDHA
jgi:hypothetical protein